MSIIFDFHPFPGPSRHPTYKRESSENYERLGTETKLKNFMIITFFNDPWKECCQGDVITHTVVSPLDRISCHFCYWDYSEDVVVSDDRSPGGGSTYPTHSLVNLWDFWTGRTHTSSSSYPWSRCPLGPPTSSCRTSKGPGRKVVGWGEVGGHLDPRDVHRSWKNLIKEFP